MQRPRKDGSWARGGASLAVSCGAPEPQIKTKVAGGSARFAATISTM